MGVTWPFADAVSSDRKKVGENFLRNCCFKTPDGWKHWWLPLSAVILAGHQQWISESTSHRGSCWSFFSIWVRKDALFSDKPTRQNTITVKHSFIYICQLLVCKDSNVQDQWHQNKLPKTGTLTSQKHF